MNPEIEQLIHDVLHGDATDADRERLSVWITADEANARAYLRVVMDERAIRTNLERDAARSVEALSASPDDSDAGMVLAELARLEARAEVVSIQTALQKSPAPVEDDPGSISTNDLLAAGSYLLRHSLTPKVIAAIAAVLIVGVTLLVALSGSDPIEPNVADNTPPDQQQDNTAAQAQVATLTGESYAQWDEQPGEDLRLGDALAAGQRLNLTQGFAEITTEEGAVVILEAPATIELLDNNNAIRLHAGKLVGICETQSSKGFIVRTPHMTIVDLGTRFGVDVSADSGTEVHVLDGSVQASRSSSGTSQAEPVVLTAGQAAKASARDDLLASIEPDAQRFAVMPVGSSNVLSGTGQGLAANDIDPSWQVVAIGGETLDQPVRMKVADRLSISSELAQAASGVKYLILRERIVPDIEQYVDNERIRYTVESALHLPSDFDASRSDLVMRFEADDRLLHVRINGQELAVPPNQYDVIDNKMYQMSIPSKHLRPGLNTIEVEVEDLIRSNNYVWGFGIAWHLETTEKEQP